MMKIEKAYDFRKKLLTVHESNVRNLNLAPKADEVEICDGVVIEIGVTDNVVINTAACDFIDFLATSMNVSATLSTEGKSGKGVIRLALAKDEGVDLREADGYKGFFINVDDGIEIFGADDRGVASALYYLEDLMSFAHAPFVKRGEIRKKPAFSPRMVHSGYQLDEYPDEYLARIAHEGMDAIAIFTWDVNKGHLGFVDFNDIIARAAKFGIDVYSYSFFIGGPHPDEENAYEYFDSTYGRLFRECPGLKGVSFVGEVMEFKSKDPNVSKFRCRDKMTDDLPEGKPHPGWYPCEDLPKWLKLVSDAICKEKPDADIIMWSYNWGYQPEEARVRLIENMPKNVTLQATFEQFDNRKCGDVVTAVADYSLSYVGPGPYFVSEAKAAARCGIKLYTMSQAAGLTWDFGVVPYLPMPYQWMKRYEKMFEAKDEWNLLGGMENHHHGFYPSLISKFAKHAFLEPREPMEDILDEIFAGEYGEENLEKVREGFKLWSDAMPYYPATKGDFEAASRIGPAYPFCLFAKTRPISKEGAFFGNAVVGLDYANGRFAPNAICSPPRENFVSMRMRPECKSLEKMISLLEKGVEVFESIENKNEKLLSVLNLGKFLVCYNRTILHAKKWYMLKCKLYAEEERESLLKIVSDMEKLLDAEIENAKAALPLVDFDSRLGWEPTMEYLGDRAHIEWKIRQVGYVLEKEMVKLKASIELEF